MSKKHNIPVQVAVMPYFKGENESKIRKDKITVNRHSVIAIIKHPFEDKYLCEESLDGKYRSFVQGGIEAGETTEQAALREVYEETGYNNVKILDVSKIPVINHFYAAYKGENGTNRFAKLEIVSGILESLQQFEIDESEKKKHTIKWIEKEKLKDFININHNRYALEYVLNDKKIYDGDGIICSDDHNNNKESKDVREYIIKNYCN
jgi:8-oxo-dGTP pyrophosphatase MutT (NUDIX family)